jgi:insertion element IS1 protein InsB
MLRRKSPRVPNVEHFVHWSNWVMMSPFNRQRSPDHDRQRGIFRGLDEIWSFVHKKDHQRWLWTAMCRRTRQIGAFVIGDRSKATCLRFWKSIPDQYKHCHSFSDFGQPLDRSFPQKPISVLGRKRGKRPIWNAGTIRYVNGLVGTCGRHSTFPASDVSHQLITKWFIVQYNLSLSLTT